MSKALWLNLPVRDLEASRAFYASLGFRIHDNHPDPGSVALTVGEPGVTVMLFPVQTFERFAGIAAADTGRGAEVLVSVGADSREEVDALAAKAERAGGQVYGRPGSPDGWMYGCGFADPDGHRWNVLYMDPAQAPGGGAK
ncbi:VOC family protein [Cohnella nanjingensis]|uniref:VOC family protein n=1 Tax=Cohnella nanjingensis TaxID=1387779 RepID=A0A7X0RKE2_9BACL|nr:VOC family protein [Cohnella nanjingensis]MBB6669093.1 VOC family protein [Cohnella nanjingensis]